MAEILRCLLCCLEPEQNDYSVGFGFQGLPDSEAPNIISSLSSYVAYTIHRFRSTNTSRPPNLTSSSSSSSSTTYSTYTPPLVQPPRTPTTNPSTRINPPPGQHPPVQPIITAPRQNPIGQPSVAPRQNPVVQPFVTPKQNPVVQSSAAPKQNPLVQPTITAPRQNPVPSQPSKPPPLSSLGSYQSSAPSLQSVPNKAKYVQSEKGKASFLYSTPDDVKALLERDVVPPILDKPLTSSTYDKYFAALLYAEDVYVEKWSSYCLNSVQLELHKAEIYAKSSNNRNLVANGQRDDKVFVAFRIDSIPERRPFLLSRDFVLLQPVDKTAECFRGILYRVVKGNLVLAEFEDDFHRQHSSNHKYNVSFSFNRVCLKRCHQAVAAAADPLFQSILFPDQKSRIVWLDNSPRVMPYHRNLNKRQLSAVNIISRLKVSPPFLVEGPLSVVSTTKRLSNTKSVHEKELSETGMVIRESVLQILRTRNDCRILINAPTNSLCDVLMRSLKEEIPESEMFRANAAFRELDGVPCDILPLCPFRGECFTCPPIQELRKFKVVLSTFVSSFRLHNEGITAGHFSHILLVDASSTTEPEAMVPLANLADEKTVVVVAGATGNSSGWVRSDIARRCGLKISYFQRLLEANPYCSPDSEFVACIREKGLDLNAISSNWKGSGNRNGY